MTCKIFIFCFLLLVMSPAAFSQAADMDPGAPTGNLPCRIVHHLGYSLCYNTQFEQAEWVMYKLTRDEVENDKVSRKDINFQPDPDVPGCATKDDFRNSGYDKGHLAPAADMRWNARAMKESFYLSNISPQLHEFNAGIWEDLENDVRDWAERLGEVYVVTGPILQPGLPTIGPDHVAVPRFFYKVLLYRNADATEAIGFVMPNAPSAETPETFAIPVDSVEALTELNFFSTLPPAIQDNAESHVDTKFWMQGLTGGVKERPHAVHRKRKSHR